MRRILIVTTIALAATCLLPWPALSKGLEEHAKVAIRGPGLAEPIQLSGEDAFLFVNDPGRSRPNGMCQTSGATSRPTRSSGRRIARRSGCVAGTGR
jgi:hypothetical protein